MTAHDEDYSRNTSCALRLMSAFAFILCTQFIFSVLGRVGYFPKIALTLQIYHMQVLHLVTESNHFTSRKNYRKRKISNCCCQLLISLYVLHFTLQHTCGILNMNATVPLAEQELLIHVEHMCSPSVFSGVRVTRSLVLCVCFVDRCLSLCPFSFSHCVVCSSLI